MREVASGLVLAVAAFVYFLGAQGLPSGQEEPGPRLFPFLLAGTLFVLAVSIIVRGLGDRKSFEGAPGRPAVLIILTVLYALSMTPVGFLVTTLVYTAGVVWLLGGRGWRTLAIPVATAALIYGAFALGLGVVLP